MTHAEAETDTVERAKVHWGVFLAPFALMLLPAVFAIWSHWFAWVQVTQMQTPIKVEIPFKIFFRITLTFWLQILPFSLPWLLLLLVMIFEVRNLAHRVTTTHVRFKSGWFCLGRGEVRLADLEAAFMVESFIGSVLGYGKVKVTVRGGAVLAVRFVPDSRQFCMQLQDAIGSVRAGRQLLPLGYRPGNALSDLSDGLSQTAQDDSRYMPKD